MKTIASFLLALVLFTSYGQVRPGLGTPPSTGSGGGSTGPISATQVTETAAKRFVTNEQLGLINQINGLISNGAGVVGNAFVFSGDGTTNSFSIPHGLNAVPATFTIDPGNPLSAGIWYQTADATNLTFYYPIAPPTGSNNGLVYWTAKANSTSGGGSGGTFQFSGNGTTSSFSIPHGLGLTPSSVSVSPGNPASAGIWYFTKDATTITFYYSVAPADGDNNGLVFWTAKP